MTLVALATALVLAAPPAAPARPPAARAPAATSTAAAPGIDTPKIPFQRFVLSNGLVLIVHEDHKAPIAAVNVWYHVGSKNERPGKTGFAHLFEHLMFNGSEHFNDDWFKVLERIGGTDLNGSTDSNTRPKGRFSPWRFSFCTTPRCSSRRAWVTAPSR